MSRNFSVDSFKWVEETSQFDKDFIKITMKIVMKGIFLKLMFNILKIEITFKKNYLPIFLERMNFEKVVKFLKNL